MSLTQQSKFLSLVLRHKPDVLGLTLDPQGWVSVEALLAAMAANGRALDRAGLERVVAGNDKKRFEFSDDGGLIRARQGHSVDVDLGYAPAAPPARLYHGTVARNLDAIRREGLLKGRRHHVHLSPDAATARTVGSRRGAPVILAIDAAAMSAAGHSFYRTGNDVWLTDAVPPAFIGFPGD